MFCSNCGKEIQEGDVFCNNCGVNIASLSATCENPSTDEDMKNQEIDQSKDNLADILNKVKENEFVKSVKSDVGNSQSLNVIKEKVASTVEKAKSNQVTRKINKKIVLALVAVIAILVVVLNLHKCEECEEIYFGEKNIINFWGEYAEVCDDCYEGFYSW